MATLGGAWANSYALLQTTTGTYRAAYHPQKDGSAHSEHVLIAGPGDEVTPVHTPRLGGFALASEGGELMVWYLELPGNVERRERSGIPCGEPVAAHTFGGVGPIGPAGAKGDTGERGDQGPAGPAGEDAVALTADDIDRIAERVWLMPPPEHLKDLAGVDLGALSQIVIAYLMTQRQDVKQLEIQRFDEAAFGLLSGNYQPKVGG
jgi:hypothetical protein